MECTDAYAAGLVDGEGTITLTRVRKTAKRRHPVVSFPSTSEELVDWFQSEFGGIKIRKRVYAKHHRPSWVVTVRYTNAIACLARIVPFLRHTDKLRRAKLILEEYQLNTVRNGQYTEEQQASKRKFEHEFFHPSTPVKVPMSL